MDPIKYKKEHKGYKTRGLRRLIYRSQTEARWAQFLEYLKWEWDYELEARPGYVPDFMIQHPMTDRYALNHQSLLLEVKADCRLEQLRQYLYKIKKSEWEGLTLVVGGKLFWTPENLVRIGIDRDGSEVYLHKCPLCRTFCVFEKTCGHCMISTVPATREDVEPLWAESQNQTRWEPVKPPPVMIPKELLSGESGCCALVLASLKSELIWTGLEDFGFKWNPSQRIWKPVNLFQECRSRIPEILIPEYRDWIQKCKEASHQEYIEIKSDYKRLEDGLDLIGDLDRIRRILDAIKNDLYREETTPERIDLSNGHSIWTDHKGLRTHRDYCLETLNLDHIAKTSKFSGPELIKRFLGYLVSGYTKDGTSIWIRNSKVREWWIRVAGLCWRGKTIVDRRENADLALDLDFDPDRVSLLTLQDGIKLYREKGLEECRVLQVSSFKILHQVGKRIMKIGKDWLVGKKRIRRDLFITIAR